MQHHRSCRRRRRRDGKTAPAFRSALPNESSLAQQVCHVVNVVVGSDGVGEVEVKGEQDRQGVDVTKLFVFVTDGGAK